MSCNQTTEGDDPTPEDTDYSLFGFVRDEDGNIITDANIYVDIGFIRVAVGDTLPVELSSFSATLTAQNFVKLTWVTESETYLSGFQILRSETNDLHNAIQISWLIDATNTSQTQTYSFIDNEVSPVTTYYYWLEVIEMAGTTSFHGPVSIYVNEIEIPVPPLQWALGNAYPNPTNTYCSIPIAIPAQASDVTLKIKSLVSGVIKTLLVGPNPGLYSIYWDGRDSLGTRVCSGVYQAQLTAKTPEGNILFDKTINILLNDSALANEPVVRSSATGYKISYLKYFQFGTIIHHTGANGENFGDYVIPQQFNLVVTKPGYQTVEKQINITNLNASQQEDIVLMASTKRKFR
jgi:hypothetical protein